MTAAHPGFAAVMADLFGAAPPARVGVALSGGGDSTALLALAAGWAAAAGVALAAATVDHGLRPGARAEAAAAGEMARGLGVAHDILAWQGWTGRATCRTPRGGRAARCWPTGPGRAGSTPFCWATPPTIRPKPC
ncbi:MAG: hypothetical protein JKP98_20640 [Rhodobacteraceae bacterium]|nr:hypothetical protein [Paracoccaceae bacterium]